MQRKQQNKQLDADADADEHAHHHDQMPLKRVLYLCTDKQYLLQMVCFAVLISVSFSIPGVGTAVCNSSLSSSFLLSSLLLSFFLLLSSFFT
jgi:predicted phage tail protein